MGGMAAPNISAFAHEYTWPETVVTAENFLEHGAAVTSALLFGPVQASQPVLPIPFAPVDHYRIATPHDEEDPEMFDAVNRICEVLDRRRHQSKGKHMTKDDIIDMAQEAGFVEYELDDGTTNAFDIRYQRFANLVAEHEREECARMCNEADKSTHPADLAAAIRARRNT
jgi:hypothetical protein